MALKFLIQFPIFAPPPDQSPYHHRPVTEIHFARWNNANAQKFIRQERTQKEIEDQLRLHKRFNSVDKIAKITPHIASPLPTFKSTGTPSTPSRPSIPGKKSKYSKPPENSHPAFRQIVRPRKIPNDGEPVKTVVKVSDSGVSYVIPEAPFEFQYSYTESPKVKPLKLREPPIAPFGPGTMPRPWTGRKPLAPSRKNIEFDSFKLPPPHKKGVKPVQAPGPYLPGSGPRYAKSREEIMGEPLSEEEIDELVKGCKKSQRQINMGRDGLTHNMLENIHSHWKRKRVCKIKCLGVCTVDMDNVRQQLEEKTGGKIIRGRGGILYLFRGRNYNFRTRPTFPLMLWKPASPVYPRLVQRAPDGLTLEEASDMRRKGRQLTPICKLGKNGVYCDLVKNVREAFDACELVRINCQGMNGSDYRKIGAKLKDLVPCVLISFEAEHILMWRGNNWKSSLPELEDKPQDEKPSDCDDAASIPCISNLSTKSVVPDSSNKSEDSRKEDGEDIVAIDGSHSVSSTESYDIPSSSGEGSGSLTESLVGTHQTDDLLESVSIAPLADEASQDLSENRTNSTDIAKSPRTEGVLLLLKQAVEGGSAVVLDDSCLDADIVYQKAAALAKSAPPEPIFSRRMKNAMTQNTDKQEPGDEEVKKVETVSEKRISERRSPRIQRKKEPKDDYLTVVPQGSLRVDELAKLLA